MSVHVHAWEESCKSDDFEIYKIVKFLYAILSSFIICKFTKMNMHAFLWNLWDLYIVCLYVVDIYIFILVKYE